MVAGTVAAVAAALAFALWRARTDGLPIAMALRAVPLVAMTPLIALVFGRGLLSVTVIAGIVTFFPVLVNVSLALRAVPASALDLMHAYGGSRFTRSGGCRSPRRCRRSSRPPGSPPRLPWSARCSPSG